MSRIQQQQGCNPTSVLYRDYHVLAAATTTSSCCSSDSYTFVIYNKDSIQNNNMDSTQSNLFCSGRRGMAKQSYNKNNKSKKKKQSSNPSNATKNKKNTKTKNSRKRKLPKLPKVPKHLQPERLTTKQVPPMQLLPTASPHVYIATCAALEFDIDPKSLFADVAAATAAGTSGDGNHDRNTSVVKDPYCFHASSFEYVSPKSLKNDYPEFPHIPEVAFLGRSNVGKSSLINALLRRKDLARCSKTPGRTQRVNYFALLKSQKLQSYQYNRKLIKNTNNNHTDKWGGSNSSTSSTTAATKQTFAFDPMDATAYFVDLPGYGYAAAPGAKVEEWQKNTQEFLIQRRDFGTLRNVMVLVDARQGPTQFDRNVMGWFDEADIPYSIIVTKADRVSKPQLVKISNDMCLRYHSQMYSGDDGNQPTGTQGPIIHLTSSKTGDGLRELRSSIDADFLSFINDTTGDEAEEGHEQFFEDGYDSDYSDYGDDDDDDDDDGDNLYDFEQEQGNVESK